MPRSSVAAVLSLRGRFSVRSKLKIEKDERDSHREKRNNYDFMIFKILFEPLDARLRIA
jgi:hypothetical protein